MNLKAFLFLKSFLLYFLKNERALAICAASIAIWSLNSVYSLTNSERLMEVAKTQQHSLNRKTYGLNNDQRRSQMQDNYVNSGHTTELVCKNRQDAIKNIAHPDSNLIALGFFFLPFLLHVPDLLHNKDLHRYFIPAVQI
ncbi:hypothetical protein ACO0K0_07400 [Undibacterium sp. SXout11W]|uniref:hypothetical protein n=1 Tax=Undibacterium sp. SXout11W TaxID=3413050 RepID=UPI003BF15503